MFKKEEIEKFGIDKYNHILDYISQSNFKPINHQTLSALFNKAEKYFQKKREIDSQKLSSSENTIDYYINNGYELISQNDKYVLFKLTSPTAVKIEGIRMHNCIGGYTNFTDLYSLKSIHPSDPTKIKSLISIENKKQFKGVANSRVNITRQMLELPNLQDLINEDEFKYKLHIDEFELIERKEGPFTSDYFRFKDWVIFNSFIIF